MTYAAVVEALPDPALMFDRDGRLLLANEAARSEFDVRSEQRLTVLMTLGSPEIAKGVEEARATLGRVSVDLRLGDRDVTAVCAAIADDVLVILSDRSAALRVDAVRRDFVANASHELKTPVAGIHALADALEVTLDRDPQRARALVSRLRGEAERLSHLVHDLIDLRRLEDGTAPSRHGAVDLAALVNDAVSTSEPAATERGLTLTVHTPERAVVAGDSEDLHLIAANLIDNAVVYNVRDGSVEVRLEPMEGAWRLTVADTGIGIPRADLDRIFERFYRVDVARSRATGGTGLGLALVRHAAERQGGTVLVDSLLGEGTTFTVMLPVERSR